MDSETESISDCYEEFENSAVDIFISEETDYIMDIYYDLENRFPYFLDKARFCDIFHFIVDNKFGIYKNNKKYYSRNMDYFIYEYKSEIDASFYVINNYLSKFKNCSIDYTIFLKFAYDFTTIC